MSHFSITVINFINNKCVMSFVSYFKLHYPMDPFSPNTAFYKLIQKHNIWKFTATLVKLSRNSNYFPMNIISIIIIIIKTSFKLLIIPSALLLVSTGEQYL